MSKILPLLLALFGLAAGAGAGYVLRPAPDQGAGGTHFGAKGPDHAPKKNDGHGAADGDHGEDARDAGETSVEFVKLNNQFVVPVVEDARVAALVVLAVSLEVATGERANVYQMEPKIRDAFLSVLFDHANAGGFRGTFTASTNMTALRLALLESAQRVMGPVVQDVLIIDIVRQDS